MARTIEVIITQPGNHPGDDKETSEAGTISILKPGGRLTPMPLSRLSQTESWRQPSTAMVVWERGD